MLGSVILLYVNTVVQSLYAGTINLFRPMRVKQDNPHEPCRPITAQYFRHRLNLNLLAILTAACWPRPFPRETDVVKRSCRRKLPLLVCGIQILLKGSKMRPRICPSFYQFIPKSLLLWENQTFVFLELETGNNVRNVVLACSSASYM